MNEQAIMNDCQLCGSRAVLADYFVLPAGYAANELALCPACLAALARNEPDTHYWRFLATAMWSDIPAVQVLAWRLLNRLSGEAWAADLLELLYLDEDLLNWAKAGSVAERSETAGLHRDSLGNKLQTGNTVVLTHSLDVKGSALTAKMGTVVKNIRLVADHTEQIEGKIGGQLIVILTKYLRKQKTS